MYILSTQEAYIHIPNAIESIYVDLHERQMTQGVFMYILRFCQNTHIHEMKTHDHKSHPKWEYTLEMYVSSKLDYTSTYNGFK